MFVKTLFRYLLKNVPPTAHLFVTLLSFLSYPCQGLFNHGVFKVFVSCVSLMNNRAANQTCPYWRWPAGRDKQTCAPKDDLLTWQFQQEPDYMWSWVTLKGWSRCDTVFFVQIRPSDEADVCRLLVLPCVHGRKTSPSLMWASRVHREEILLRNLNSPTWVTLFLRRIPFNEEQQTHAPLNVTSASYSFQNCPIRLSTRGKLNSNSKVWLNCWTLLTFGNLK